MEVFQRKGKNNVPRGINQDKQYIHTTISIHQQDCEVSVTVFCNFVSYLYCNDNYTRKLEFN